jgi:hypothetical protein
MKDGLLRSVAQLFFGGQAPHTIEYAEGWLRRRSNFTTALLFEELASRVSPRRLVEKSPSIVYKLEYMRRALKMFPQARFIHLTRHPLGQGASVMKALRRAERLSEEPFWLLNLASYPHWPEGKAAQIEALNSNPPPDHPGPSCFDADPLRAWYALNANIREFLRDVPRSQWLRVKGEAVVSEPDSSLIDITRWLGIATDAEALEAMKHPERSDYAFFGPENAPLGNDGDYLSNPTLRVDRAKPWSLDEHLPWATEESRVSEEVRSLASEFGYD